MIQILRSKIHGAIVTEADLNYEGSITIDPILIEASGMIPFERVQVLNCNNGERIETYIIEGERGKGEICLNRAAARLFYKGDRVIILAYEFYKSHINIKDPIIIFPDKDNHLPE